MEIARGILGIVCLLGISYLLSNNRKAIDWKMVGMGLTLQFLLAILIMQVREVRLIFDYVASFFVVVINFTEEGARFVLGDWPQLTEVRDGASGNFQMVGYIFAFKVLPTIVFFSALSSLLYYLGILQIIIKMFAWVMVRTMRLTGTESLAAAANVFIGQTEAPLVVKPYLEQMSRSEIMCLMTGGMATIAGGVFAAYVGFLGGSDPVLQQKFATHLLTASIMSAPAAIVAAKMLYPEIQKDVLKHQKLEVSREKVGNNLLDAIAIGTTDGLKLAINVGAMLLVFTAMIAMLNYMLENWIGTWTGLNEYVQNFSEGQFDSFSIEFLLGLLFAPFAWMLGIADQDILSVGRLLGLKTTLNEFYAYAALEGVKADLQERSLVIVTYALCGFANFASIGIQIGGISAIAPGQKKTLTELGLLALIGGTIACFYTATIAGMLFQN